MLFRDKALLNCMLLFLKEAKKALLIFPYLIKKPAFVTLGKKKFTEYLEGSPLLLNLGNTPSFVAHLPDGELICLCPEIINNLTKNKSENYRKRFVQAITMHELFHIHNMHLALTENDALKSEKEVHRQLEKEFPGLAKILARK